MQEASRESSKESSFTVLTKISPPNIVGRMMIQIAVVVGGLMVLSVLLGRYLDAQLQTNPLFTVGVTFLGTITSAYVTYKLGLRAVDKSNTISPAPKPESDKIFEANHVEQATYRHEAQSDTV
jgi:F0F1-type ATP synthase assembly protein I